MGAHANVKMESQNHWEKVDPSTIASEWRRSCTVLPFASHVRVVPSRRVLAYHYTSGFAPSLSKASVPE